MKNSDTFIEKYNAIDSWLRKSYKSSNNYDSFFYLIDKASKKNGIINYYREDLKSIGNLRNAIVHNRRANYIIAEPHEDIVALINDIENKIKSPPLVNKFFFEVYSVRFGDTIGTVAESMYKESYSQSPILEGSRIVGLLTSNSITRWLGANVNEDIFSLSETTVEEVFKFSEFENNYEIVNRHTNLYDIRDIFVNEESKGRAIQALLINESGNETDTLLGLISIFSMPELISYINN